MSVIDALLAIAASDRPTAIAAAEAAAAADPSSLVAPALVRHLRRTGAEGVYDEPTAFERFIGGGGNPALYDRTIEAVRAVHAVAPASVLDVGCGDGRVTAAVVGPGTISVDLVEPSGELLTAARAAVAAAGPEVRWDATGIDVHLGAHPERGWDLVQSTFALHALEPELRSSVLAELARRSERLVVVDFDVPVTADRSVEHAAYVAERYELGLAEYADDPEVVDGFLLPVMIGQFDPTRVRHTFEQPAAAWVAQLEAAGWSVEVEEISPYWWATACCFDATVTRTG
ncbi:MAG: class I SAM-dependent methyltransferase [Actinomycetota bacterium]